MKIRFNCGCGHINYWKMEYYNISNFICEECGQFHGSSNGRIEKWCSHVNREDWEYVPEQANATVSNISSYTINIPVLLSGYDEPAWYISGSPTDVTYNSVEITSDQCHSHSVCGFSEEPYSAVSNIRWFTSGSTTADWLEEEYTR